MQWAHSCEQICLDRNQNKQANKVGTQVAHMIYDADDDVGGGGGGGGAEWLN